MSVEISTVFENDKEYFCISYKNGRFFLNKKDWDFSLISMCLDQKTQDFFRDYVSEYIDSITFEDELSARLVSKLMKEIKKYEKKENLKWNLLEY